MESNQNPKVYVGTYHKYNSGSIDGAWIDLVKCGTYAIFLKKCYEIHKDEREPEFMVQDYECFPDGLGCMEWLSEKEFNDVISEFSKSEEDNTPKCQIIDYSEKAIVVIGDTYPIKKELKKLGGLFNSRLSCGAGWIFSKAKLADVQSLINGKTSIETFDNCLDEYLKTLKLPSDVTYYKRNNIGAVRANGGYILIEKPSIENKFCFHDEGPQYEAYLEITKTDDSLQRHFLAENLKQVSRKIKILEDERILYVTQPSEYNGTISWNNGRYGERWNATDIEMSQEVRAELLKAYKASLAMFEKRLHTYLKRYGTSKIHTWTYWADA